MRSLLSGLVVTLTLAAFPAVASAQTSWVVEWLGEYAAGGEDRTAVTERFQKVVNLDRLRADLDELLDTWLEMGESEDTQRRLIAAFALEAAYARLGMGKSAVDLAEWGCRQVRRLRNPGEFEHEWHLAAFALYAGAVDPDAIESHANHMRLQFRDEPRLGFQRAVAEELKAAPFFENGKASLQDVRKRYEEAAERYEEAAEDENVRVEANVRRAHSLLQLGRHDEALATLEGIGPETEDDFLLYLAHLFRGQALEGVDRNDDAIREYGLALGIRPRAQSASMAQAALLFKVGRRGLADQIVTELLGRTDQPDDPWWNYWPADYRFAERLMASMREAIQ